jgi:hypothetical protein
MPFQFLDLSAGISVRKSSRVDAALTPSVELRNLTYTRTFDVIKKSDCELDEYLALTQVCQQIRAEFRPIFLSYPLRASYVRRCVPWLHALLPGWDDPSVDKADFTANLHASHVAECLSDGISFVAFLRLYIEAPHVNVHIGRDGMGERAMSMLRCKAEWAELLRNGHVAAIVRMRVSKRGWAFRIVLARDFTASWLITGPEGEKHIDNRATRFVNNLGAGKLPRRPNMSAAILGIQADKEGCTPICHHALRRELPWGPISHGRDCLLYKTWSEGEE